MQKIKLSLVAVGVYSTAIMAIIIAFLGASLYSDAEGHLGTRGIEIEEDHRASDRDGFYFELANFAREQGFEISIGYASLSVSGGEKRVYSTSIPREGGRVEKGRFQSGQSDVFYPLENFPQADPRQTIEIKGTAADEETLSHWLQSVGFEVVPLTNYAWEIIGASSIPVLLLLSMLLCLVLGAGHVLSRSREIGVHRLLGLSIYETIMVELHRLRWVFAIAYVGTPLCVAVLLYLYNGWALAGVFWGVCFSIVMLLFTALLAGYLAGQSLVRATSIPQAIKGRIHARPILYSLVLVRSVALIVALSAVSTLVSSVAELNARENLQAGWDAHQGPREFALNNNTDFEVWAGSETAKPFRDADEERKVFLVDPYWITFPTQLEAPVLLVNQEFAGQAGVSKMNRDDVTVCSPKRLSGESKRVIEDALDFEAEYTDNSTPPIDWREECALGAVFTYDVDQEPLVTDPILVILPLGLGPLGDHNLMASVSRHVIITASSEIPTQLLDGATGGALAYQKPREDAWMEKTRLVERSVMEWGLNTLAAALLVSVLVGATITTFRITYRRKIHIGYICGRSPWWIARLLVTLELMFFFGTLAWLFYKLREYRIQAESGIPSTWNIGFENQWSPGVIAGVVAFAATWLVVTVWLAVRAAGTWDAREGMEHQ